MGSSNDILVTSKAVLDDEIVDADVKSTAAIAESKFAFDSVAGHNHDGSNSAYVAAANDPDLANLGDLEYIGEAYEFTGSVVAGEEPLVNKTCRLKADGTIAIANATDLTEMPVYGLVIADLTGNQWLVLRNGVFRQDGVGLAIGELFQGIVDGQLTVTEPNVVGNVVQKIGRVIKTNYLDIRPSNDYAQVE